MYSTYGQDAANIYIRPIGDDLEIMPQYKEISREEGNWTKRTWPTHPLQRVRHRNWLLGSVAALRYARAETYSSSELLLVGPNRNLPTRLYIPCEIRRYDIYMCTV